NHELAGGDVVASRNIILRIEPEEVRVPLIDLLGMNSTELSVGSGIAEIKCELPGLHLDRQRIRRGRFKVDLAPRLSSHGSERNGFRANQHDRRDDEILRTARKVLQRAILPSAKLPHKETEHELRGKKGQARLDHGLIELLVDLGSMRRDVLGWR